MNMHIEIHGQARSGAPSLLLSSGLGGSAGFWKPQIPALVEAGWRVVCYDQRGTGRSPATLGEDYAIEIMVRDVVEVLSETETDRCILIGHALGGLVGLQLALDAPKKVEGLVLVNAWAEPNSHSARCFDARLELLRAVGPRAYVEAQPIFLYPAAWCAEHAVDVQAEVNHAFTHFPGEANMRARIAALRAFDVSAQLKNIQVPILVMASMDDVLVPWTMSQRLSETLPNATFDRVPHGGHAHSVTTPDSFNRSLLTFLAQQVEAS